MKLPLRRMVLLFCCIHFPAALPAQTDETPFAAWLLPGISWRASEKTQLLGELGYSRYYRAGLGYGQGFITVHKHIVLNPAYLFLLYKNAAQAYRQEHFLMNAVIWQFPIGNYFIDDRNMLWNRFIVHDKPVHYYRNRLRLARSFQLGPALLKLYGYDEIFFSFDNGRLTRNRLALGTSCDIFHRANVDITFIRQWDRAGGRLYLFFIMGTWRVG